MAKGPKKPPTAPIPGRFGPGNQASKGHGRPPLAPEVKAIRQVNRALVERMINQFLAMPLAELEAMVVAKSTLALEALVAKVVIMGINGGDTARLNYLLEQMLGKLPEAPRDVRVHVLQAMPPGQVVTLAREAIAFLEGGSEPAAAAPDEE